MDYRKTAREIYDHIGKKENIISAAHCATRLRLVIGDKANVSPAYLSALFKKKQGVSISDYITTQRINAACRYLTATNMTLKEISMKCGYANQYYFSTSFKKKMNVTPSAYRDTQTSKS